MGPAGEGGSGSVATHAGTAARVAQLAELRSSGTIQRIRVACKAWAAQASRQRGGQAAAHCGGGGGNLRAIANAACDKLESLEQVSEALRADVSAARQKVAERDEAVVELDARLQVALTDKREVERLQQVNCMLDGLSAC